jgi:hypothetical protein
MTGKNRISRIGKRELEKIADALGDRDRHILESLKAYKYLTTEQIRKLHFTDEHTEKAHSKADLTDTADTTLTHHSITSDYLSSLRAANRTLAKLKELGAINHLTRRIGGVRAGSGSFVWSLTMTGARLVSMFDPALADTERKRFYEPSPSFLTHILAVAETGVRLTGLCHSGDITLKVKQTEPNCWRQYTGMGGQTIWLRPDLFAITSSGDFIDHWFFEIDLATESPVTVVKKCALYLAYRQSGAEQRTRGVFPYVVWIVPDNKRKTSLTNHLSENIRGETKLFVFITMNELEQLITQGAEAFREKKGMG